MSDRELLQRRDDLMLLRAVAAGRVVRGDQGGETSVFSPHYLDGRLIRTELRRRAAKDLITMPISARPPWRHEAGGSSPPRMVSTQQSSTSR